MMVYAKNYDRASTFVKVIQRKLLADMVYLGHNLYYKNH